MLGDLIERGLAVVPSIVEKVRMEVTFHQLEGSHVFLAASPCFDVDSQDPETIPSSKSVFGGIV